MHAHNWFITLFSLYIVLNLWHLSRVPLEERQQYPLLEWRCGNEGKRNGNNNNVKIPQERKKTCSYPTEQDTPLAFLLKTSQGTAAQKGDEGTHLSPFCDTFCGFQSQDLLEWDSSQPTCLLGRVIYNLNKLEATQRKCLLN